MIVTTIAAFYRMDPMTRRRIILKNKDFFRRLWIFVFVKYSFDAIVALFLWSELHFGSDFQDFLQNKTNFEDVSFFLPLNFFSIYLTGFTIFFTKQKRCTEYSLNFNSRVTWWAMQCNDSAYLTTTFLQACEI